MPEKLRFLAAIILWLVFVPGHTGPEPPAPTLALEASADTQVPRQRLVISLSASAEGPEPAALAKTVNRTMKWALDQVHEPVEASTTDYQTRRVTRKGETVSWHVSQRLRLAGMDDEALLALAGRLQARMEITAMEYEVSTAARDEAVERLIPQAIAAFEQRAEIAARAYRSHCHVLQEASLRTDADRPFPVFRTAAMEAMAEAPSVPAGEGGRAEIRVTMQGSIRLVPCKR